MKSSLCNFSSFSSSRPLEHESCFCRNEIIACRVEFSHFISNALAHYTDWQYNMEQRMKKLSTSKHRFCSFQLIKSFFYTFQIGREQAMSDSEKIEAYYTLLKDRIQSFMIFHSVKFSKHIQIRQVSHLLEWFYAEQSNSI